MGPRAGREGCGKSRPYREFLCILLYSVLHPYLFLCLYRPTFSFCLYLTTQALMRPAGFEPATPESDRPQILALDR